MANYAEITTQRAFLNQRFGIALLQAHCGLSNDIIEGIVGRYSRGKRKGQLRGAVIWKKVVRGGWVKNGFEGGHVEFPGRIFDVHIVDAFTLRPL
jgi:hypothetical protein